MRQHTSSFAAPAAGILLSASLAGPCFADANILSNLGLIEQLTRGAVSDVVEQLEIPVGSPIVVVSLDAHEGNIFVKDRLAKALTDRGYDVIVSRTGADEAVAEEGAVAPGGAAPGGAVPGAGPGAGAGGVEPTSADDTTAADPDPFGEDATSDGTAGAGAAGENDLGLDGDPFGDGEPEPGEDPFGEDAEELDEGDGSVPAVGGTGSAGNDTGLEGGVSRGVVAPSGAYGDPLALAQQALRYASGSASAVAPTVLDVEILEFGVRYSEIGRKLLVGPVQFTRVAGVYLRVTEHDGGSGFMRDMITAERHHWDRVSGRERLLAEGASYPFERPELKAPGLGTYLEPALVVGIVGGLIYLFYENQN